MTDNNLIEGNLIGTDPHRDEPPANTGPGVEIVNGSSNNSSAARPPGAGNTIAFNGGAGVVVGSYSGDQAIGNAILSNSIYGNGGLGIDLGDDGVTLNTPGGPHSGPNDLQNFPVLSTPPRSTAAPTSSGRSTAPQHNLHPAVLRQRHGRSQRLRPGPDPDRHDDRDHRRQRQRLVLRVVPDVVPAGQAVSATATDPSGDTSEFAQDVTVVAATSPVVAVNDTYNIDENKTLTVPAPGVLGNDYRPERQSLSAVLVTSTSHGTLSFQSDGSFTYTPNANFVGTDTFTYYATDGTYESNVPRSRST